jgi:hypothetical protein
VFEVFETTGVRTLALFLSSDDRIQKECQPGLETSSAEGSNEIIFLTLSCCLKMATEPLSETYGLKKSSYNQCTGYRSKWSDNCRLCESTDVPDQERTKVVEINVTYRDYIYLIQRAFLVML